MLKSKQAVAKKYKTKIMDEIREDEQENESEMSF